MRRYVRFQKRVNQLRNQLQPRSVLQKLIANISFPQRSDFLSLLQRDRRSRVIVGFHSGHFIYAMNYLASLESDSRKQFVLSHSLLSEACFSNLELCFPQAHARPDQQLLMTEYDSLKLSKLLRGGNTTLYIYCDLPQQYGAAESVPLCGRPASLPRGPAALAISNRLPLLPWITFTAGGRHVVLVGPQIDPRDYAATSVRQAVRLVTARLAAWLTTYLQRHPEQWRYLPCLPDYFH